MLSTALPVVTFILAISSLISHGFTLRFPGNNAWEILHIYLHPCIIGGLNFFLLSYTVISVSEYMHFVRYMICKYFLLVQDLSFHFLNFCQRMENFNFG